MDGDPVSLGHLVLNLIENAMQAAGPDGKVRIVVTANAVEVRDDGPGPSAAVAARLFEPFVTGRPDGIGLGLAVAKRAAAAHRARLDWTRDGDETVFRVDWPT